MKVMRRLTVLVLLFALLCLSWAEEDLGEIQEEETATTATTTTTTIESKLESKDEAENQTRELFEIVSEVAARPVDKDGLITVKKTANSEAEVQVPPWDPRSTLGKPPPTRPPYK